MPILAKKGHENCLFHLLLKIGLFVLYGGAAGDGSS